MGLPVFSKLLFNLQGLLSLFTTTGCLGSVSAAFLLQFQFNLRALSWGSGVLQCGYHKGHSISEKPNPAWLMKAASWSSL